METIETVIIGAGQAGLATARELVDRGHECVVLERNEAVGDGWRQQYDSLRLYLPPVVCHPRPPARPAGCARGAARRRRGR